MARILLVLLLFLAPLHVFAQDSVALCALQKDWKKAIWRTPLHLAMSLPVAAVSLPAPWLGRSYVHWRARSEQSDERFERDTAMKAAIDFYTQTILVRRVIAIYGMDPNFRRQP